MNIVQQNVWAAALCYLLAVDLTNSGAQPPVVAATEPSLHVLAKVEAPNRNLSQTEIDSILMLWAEIAETHKIPEKGKQDTTKFFRAGLQKVIVCHDVDLSSVEI